MPSSRPNLIPTVIHLIRQLRPQSILDVGVGFGKWGHLFREYTDINEAEHDPARYARENWRVQIDGIEGFADYITEMHRYLYNHIHIGNASELMPGLGTYDVIFLGDVIEHLDKEAGRQLLHQARAHAAKAAIISTPRYDTAQPDLCANELERHRSVWTPRDFRRWDGAIVKTIDRATLLAVLPQPGIPRLICGPPVQAKPADARRMREARDELVRLIPPDAKFILVDEDQMRCELPHQRTVPFLEKDGVYWGPPADDATAIRECERLRQAGAGFIAFVWTTFWWLDHYAGFARHLRSHFPCVAENSRVILFDLRGAPAGKTQEVDHGTGVTR